MIAQTICGAYCRSAFCVKDLGVVLRGDDLLDELFPTATVRKLLSESPPLIKCNSGSKCRGFFCMATGPCQAGFAGTHYYIYLGGGEYCSEEGGLRASRLLGRTWLERHLPAPRGEIGVVCILFRHTLAIPSSEVTQCQVETAI